MLMQPADIRRCLDKAKEIAEEYKLYVLGAPHTRKSVQDLLRLFGEHLDKKVEAYGLNESLPHQSIRGYYVRFPDKYVIVISQEDLSEWRRFVVCKELFHVALDEPQYRVTKIEGHLQEVAIAFPALDSRPGPAVMSEAMAEISAMEFLFPYKERQAVLQAHPCDFTQVAERYGIPLVHVERYLSLPYMATFGAFER